MRTVLDFHDLRNHGYWSNATTTGDRNQDLLYHSSQDVAIGKQSSIVDFWIDRINQNGQIVEEESSWSTRDQAYHHYVTVRFRPSLGDITIFKTVV